ncbi:Copine_I [Hexamita inflata]|uniref:Copine_I n=1 Tax=Hexamita inflata TaxID=28002 RepID=A0ABP1HR21_9EUKA
MGSCDSDVIPSYKEQQQPFDEHNSIIHNTKQNQQMQDPTNKMYLFTDKYKTFDELNSSMRYVGIESIQCVMGFDFSASNGDLHSTDIINPYMRVIQILQPVIEQFDDDGEINAYRFGCSESFDQNIVPLYGNSDVYKGFDALLESYKAAEIQQSNPDLQHLHIQSKNVLSWRNNLVGNSLSFAF